MQLRINQGTLNIIIICVLVYLFELVAPRFNFEFINALFMHYPDHQEFRPWQLITSIFSHGSELHLLLNCLGLFFIGNILEGQLGLKKYLIVFFVSAITGTILHTASEAWSIYSSYGTLTPLADGLVSGYPEEMASCGASGGLFGIFIAFAFYMPNQKLMIIPIPIGIKAKYLALGYLAVEVILAFASVASDNIAHFAHIGGAIGGFVVVKFWFSKYLKRGW